MLIVRFATLLDIIQRFPLLPDPPAEGRSALCRFACFLLWDSEDMSAMKTKEKQFY